MSCQLWRMQRNFGHYHHLNCLKNSEKYYIKINSLYKRFYQRQDFAHLGKQDPSKIQRTGRRRVIRYKVPKTWRKYIEVVWHIWKTDKESRKKAMWITFAVTFATGSTLTAFFGFLYFFSPGGGGMAWRQKIWNEIANKDSNKSLEQAKAQGNAGWMNNMFKLGASPRIPTLEERAKMAGEDRYKSWEDVMSQGFPKTAAEYKKVSKMRPETMEDYELMADLRKRRDEAQQRGESMTGYN